MANREPLQPGTTIKYRGAVATVISDNGGDILEVECEGLRQTWEWECEGLKCRVIKKPRQERAPADKPSWLKYLVEIADGRITFYVHKGGVATKGRARKIKPESVTVKVVEGKK